MITLPNGWKCGCLPSSPVALARAPYFGYYLRNVPPGPATCQRTTAYLNWGVKLNDRYGCCVVSGWVHMKQAQSFVDAEGDVHDIPDSEVRRVYLLLSPGDNGLNIDDWLRWCEQQPMPWRGGPHGTIDPRDQQTLRKAVWWLGGVKLGIGVPREWGNNPQNGFVWDRVGHFEGVGHDVQAIDYNDRGLEIITWGLRGTITWAGLAEQCGEAHAVLAPDWYGDDRKSPPGLDVAGLTSYLNAITGQGPEPPDPVPPTPPVPPGPQPKPASCEYVRRGLDVMQRGMKILAANPSDTRVPVALDWLEGWLK